MGLHTKKIFSTGRVTLILFMSIMLVFGPVVSGVTPVLAAGGEDSVPGTERVPLSSALSSAATMLGDMFSAGDSDEPVEEASLESLLSEIYEVAGSVLQDESVAGALEDTLQDIAVQEGEGSETTALEDIVVQILRDEDLHAVLGDVIASYLELDEGSMQRDFIQQITADVYALLQNDEDGSFKDYFRGALESFMEDPRIGEIIDDTFGILIDNGGKVLDELLESGLYSEVPSIFYSFTDGVYDYINTELVNGESVADVFYGILNNAEGISEDFSEALEEDPNFNRSMDNLANVFRYALIEPLVENLEAEMEGYLYGLDGLFPRCPAGEVCENDECTHPDHPDTGDGLLGPFNELLNLLMLEWEGNPEDGYTMIGECDHPGGHSAAGCPYCHIAGDLGLVLAHIGGDVDGAISHYADGALGGEGGGGGDDDMPVDISVVEANMGDFLLYWADVLLEDIFAGEEAALMMDPLVSFFTEREGKYILEDIMDGLIANLDHFWHGMTHPDSPVTETIRQNLTYPLLGDDDVEELSVMEEFMSGLMDIVMEIVGNLSMGDEDNPESKAKEFGRATNRILHDIFPEYIDLLCQTCFGEDRDCPDCDWEGYEARGDVIDDIFDNLSRLSSLSQEGQEIYLYELAGDLSDYMSAECDDPVCSLTNAQKTSRNLVGDLLNGIANSIEHVTECEEFVECTEETPCKNCMETECEEPGCTEEDPCEDCKCLGFMSCTEETPCKNCLETECEEPDCTEEEPCEDCECEEFVRCTEDNLCADCQKELERQQQRTELSDTLVAYEDLLALYESLGGEDNNKITEDTDMAGVIMAIIKEIVSPAVCGNCEGSGEIEGVECGHCEGSGEEGAFVEYFNTLDTDFEWLKEEEIIPYGQRIGAATLGFVDRIFAPLLQLVNPRRYVHNNNEEEQERLESMLSADRIASSLRWIISPVEEFFSNQALQAHYFIDDYVIGSFLDYEYESNKGLGIINTPQRLSDIYAFTGEFVGHEYMKLLEAGFFEEDIMGTEEEDGMLKEELEEFVSILNPEKFEPSDPEDPLYQEHINPVTVLNEMFDNMVDDMIDPVTGNATITFDPAGTTAELAEIIDNSGNILSEFHNDPPDAAIGYVNIPARLLELEGEDEGSREVVERFLVGPVEPAIDAVSDALLSDELRDLVQNGVTDLIGTAVTGVRAVLADIMNNEEMLEYTFNAVTEIITYGDVVDNVELLLREFLSDEEWLGHVEWGDGYYNSTSAWPADYQERPVGGSGLEYLLYLATEKAVEEYEQYGTEEWPLGFGDHNAGDGAISGDRHVAYGEEEAMGCDIDIRMTISGKTMELGAKRGLNAFSHSLMEWLRGEGPFHDPDPHFHPGVRQAPYQFFPPYIAEFLRNDLADTFLPRLSMILINILDEVLAYEDNELNDAADILSGWVLHLLYADPDDPQDYGLLGDIGAILVKDYNGVDPNLKPNFAGLLEDVFVGYEDPVTGGRDLFMLEDLANRLKYVPDDPDYPVPADPLEHPPVWMLHDHIGTTFAQLFKEFADFLTGGFAIENTVGTGGNFVQNLEFTLPHSIVPGTLRITAGDRVAADNVEGSFTTPEDGEELIDASPEYNEVDYASGTVKLSIGATDIVDINASWLPDVINDLELLVDHNHLREILKFEPHMANMLYHHLAEEKVVGEGSFTQNMINNLAAILEEETGTVFTCPCCFGSGDNCSESVGVCNRCGGSGEVDNRAFRAGYTLQDIPSRFITDLLEETDLTDFSTAVLTEEQHLPGALNEYGLGQRVMETIAKLVGSDEIFNVTLGTVTKTLTDIYETFVRRINSLGGFVLGNSQGSTQVQGSESYDEELLKAMPSLGMNTLAELAGITIQDEPTQTVTGTQEGVSPASINTDDMDEIERILKKGLGDLDTAVLDSIIREILDDEEGIKEGIRFVQEFAAGVAGDPRLADLLGNVAAGNLQDGRLGDDIKSLYDLAYDILDDDDVFKDTNDFLIDLLEDTDTRDYLSNLVSGGIEIGSDLVEQAIEHLILLKEDPSDPESDEVVKALAKSFVSAAREEFEGYEGFPGYEQQFYDMVVDPRFEELLVFIGELLIDSGFESTINLIEDERFKPILNDLAMSVASHAIDGVIHIMQAPELTHAVVGGFHDGILRSVCPDTGRLGYDNLQGAVKDLLNGLIYGSGAQAGWFEEYLGLSLLIVEDQTANKPAEGAQWVSQGPRGLNCDHYSGIKVEANAGIWAIWNSWQACAVECVPGMVDDEGMDENLPQLLAVELGVIPPDMIRDSFVNWIMHDDAVGRPPAVGTYADWIDMAAAVLSDGIHATISDAYARSQIFLFNLLNDNKQDILGGFEAALDSYNIEEIAGQIAANPRLQDDPDHADYPGEYYRDITIDHRQVGEDLEDFPVIVELDETNFDFDNARTDGHDIYFLSSDGEELDFERVIHDAGAKVAEYWVKIPEVSRRWDTSFDMFYGNPDAATDRSNPAAVWDGNYMGVWHKENLTATTIKDSTQTPYNGTKLSSTQPQEVADGKIGLAQQYSGGTDYINLGNPAGLQITGNQTIEMWLKPANTTARRNPINKAYGGEGTITQEIGGNVNYFWGTAGGDASPYQGFTMTDPVTPGEWVHLAVVRDLDAGKLRWYKDGNLTDEANTSYAQATASSADLLIGNGYTSGYYGLIDEVRISNAPRSVGWINANYHMGNGTLTTLSDERSSYLPLELAEGMVGILPLEQLGEILQVYEFETLWTQDFEGIFPPDGWERTSNREDPGYEYIWEQGQVDCLVCSGLGSVEGEDCERCAGSGWHYAAAFEPTGDFTQEGYSVISQGFTSSLFPPPGWERSHTGLGIGWSHSDEYTQSYAYHENDRTNWVNSYLSTPWFDYDPDGEATVTINDRRVSIETWSDYNNHLKFEYRDNPGVYHEIKNLGDPGTGWSDTTVNLHEEPAMAGYNGEEIRLVFHFHGYCDGRYEVFDDFYMGTGTVWQINAVNLVADVIRSPLMANAYLYSEPIYVADDDYLVSFEENRDGSYFRNIVGVVDAATDEVLYQNEVGSTSETRWRTQRVDLGMYAGKTIRVFFNYQGAGAGTWYIDNFTLGSYKDEPLQHYYDALEAIGYEFIDGFPLEEIFNEIFSDRMLLVDILQGVFADFSLDLLDMLVRSDLYPAVIDAISGFPIENIIGAEACGVCGDCTGGNPENCADYVPGFLREVYEVPCGECDGCLSSGECEIDPALNGLSRSDYIGKAISSVLLNLGADIAGSEELTDLIYDLARDIFAEEPGAVIIDILIDLLNEGAFTGVLEGLVGAVGDAGSQQAGSEETSVQEHDRSHIYESSPNFFTGAITGLFGNIIHYTAGLFDEGNDPVVTQGEITPQSTEQVLYSQDFEGAFPPMMWIQDSNTYGMDWGMSTTEAHGGTQSAGVSHLNTNVTRPTGTIAISGGHGTGADNYNVNLSLTNAGGASQMRFRNYPSGSWTSWETISGSKTGWTLDSGSNAVKTVQVQYRTADGTLSMPISTSIRMLYWNGNNYGNFVRVYRDAGSFSTNADHFELDVNGNNSIVAGTDNTVNFQYGSNLNIYWLNNGYSTSGDNNRSYFRYSTDRNTTGGTGLEIHSTFSLRTDTLNISSLTSNQYVKVRARGGRSSCTDRRSRIRTYRVWMDMHTPQASQPANQTAGVGETATFSVNASCNSGGTLSYQWMRSIDGGNTWSDISGATSATYNRTVQEGDSGSSYACRVTNGGGAVTVSDPALLLDPVVKANLGSRSVSIDSSYEEVYLEFYEKGGRLSDYDYHGIWVQEGGNDYEVQALGAPGSTWGKRTVDLSGYIGSNIRVIFRYQGADADDWYIDDVKIYVPKYQLTAQASPTVGGTVSGGGSYVKGETANMSASENSGYRFVNWTKGGQEVSTNKTFNYNMPGEDATLTANFVEVHNLSLLADPEAGGTLSGAGEYEAGDVVTLTANTNPGYEFNRWALDGVTVSTVAQFDYTMPAESVTLEAEFTAIPYTLTIQAGEGGLVSVDGNSYSESIQLTQIVDDVIDIWTDADTGYEFDRWTPSTGVSDPNAGVTTFQMPPRDHTVTANFDMIDYELAVEVEEGGTVVLNNNEHVISGPATQIVYYNYNDVINITAVPEGVYDFDGWTATAGTLGNAAAESTTFTMPAQNAGLKAWFEYVERFHLQLQADPPEGGTLYGAGFYEIGTPVEVKAVPATGYELVNWTLNGTVVSTEEEFNYTMPGEDKTLVANFAKIDYTLTIGTTGEGTTTPSGDITLNYQDVINVGASPAQNYVFINWTAGGEVVSTQPEIDYSMPAENITLLANFAKEYELTPQSEPASGGTVADETGDGWYLPGTKVKLRATVEDGYAFVNWTDQNGNILTTNRVFIYETTDEDMTLYANFTDNIPINQYITDPKLEEAIGYALFKPGSELTTRDMMNLYSLSAVGRGITDLSGLEYAENLRHLDLHNNNVSDISALQNMKHLESLHLAYNNITDIAKNITDITKLQNLSSLKELDLAHNYVPPCGECDVCTQDGCDGGPGNPEPDSECADELGVSCLDCDYCETEDSLSDIDALENLTNLRWLNLEDNSISNVKPLEGLTDINWLNLSDNEVDNNEDNRNALATLVNLERLNLSDNSISNIGFLSVDMKNLENLNLSNTSIDSNELQSLDELGGLTTLDLSGNNLTGSGLSSLGGIESLESLDLSVNGISDLDLGNITWANLLALERLDLSDNNVGNPGLLTGLENLSRLNLENNNIDDASWLSAFEGIIRLNLSGNGNISNISVIGNMEDLHYLYLAGAGINNNLSFLEGKTFKELDLSDNNISDISSLSNVEFIQFRSIMRTLLSLGDNFDLDGLGIEINFFDVEMGGGFLDLSGNDISNIAPLKGKRFQGLNLSGNNIEDISAFVCDVCAVCNQAPCGGSYNNPADGSACENEGTSCSDCGLCECDGCAVCNQAPCGGSYNNPADGSACENEGTSCSDCGLCENRILFISAFSDGILDLSYNEIDGDNMDAWDINPGGSSSNHPFAPFMPKYELKELDMLSLSGNYLEGISTFDNQWRNKINEWEEVGYPEEEDEDYETYKNYRNWSLLDRINATGTVVRAGDLKDPSEKTASEVGGEILDPEGTPLSGAEVTALESGDGTELQENAGRVYTTYTGEDGKFRLSLPAGTYRLEIRHDGYKVTEIEEIVAQRDQENRSATRINIDAVLEAMSIKLNVFNKEGEPLEDARISAWKEGGGEYHTAGGGYELPASPGTYRIEVTCDGYLPAILQDVTVDEEGNVEGVEKVVMELLTLDGKVSDVAGNPLQDAQISMLHDNLKDKAGSITGDDGTFTLGNREELLPPGSYRLETEKSGYLKAVQNLVIDKEGNIEGLEDITLELLGDVTGTGEVEIADAILVLRHIVGLTNLEEEALPRAQVNGEKLSISDAIQILRHIVGLSSLE